jgi:uncharacterized protein YbcI
MAEQGVNSVAQELGNALQNLHKQQFGRGPTQATVHFAGPNALFVVFEDALLPAERALVEAGEELRVVETRSAFQTATTGLFVGIIEQITGRTVRSFSSAVDAPNGIVYEVCLFEPQ